MLLRTRLARTGASLCLGGAALGALGLFGWISGTHLTTIVPGLPPMVPNTALALLLIGCAGAARQGDDTKRVRKVLSLLASFVVLALGVVTLAEYQPGDQSGDRSPLRDPGGHGFRGALIAADGVRLDVPRRRAAPRRRPHDCSV